MANIINYFVNSIKRFRGNGENGGGDNNGNLNDHLNQGRNIPVLVLLSIFDHLHTGDILQFRLVNHQWNSAFQLGGYFTKHFKFTISPSGMANPNKRIMVLNPQSTSAFPNVRMYQFGPVTSLDWPNDPISNIRTLELTSSTFGWVKFQQILISLVHLRSLLLDSVRIHNVHNGDFESGLDVAIRRIKSLTLKKTRIPHLLGLTDLIWPIVFLGQFKDENTLEELSLLNVTLKGENYQHPLSDSHNRFATILEELLNRNRKSLKNLTIINTKCFYHKLNRLPHVLYTQILPNVEFENEENGYEMQLRKLALPSWKDMQFYGGFGIVMIQYIGNFLENQHHLESLEIPYFPRRPNTVFQRQLIVEMTRLGKIILTKRTIKSLQIPKCEYFNDLKDIRHLPRLKKISIGSSEVSEVIDEFIPRLSFKMIPIANIRVFEVHSRTPNLTGKISFLCHLLPNLEELSLGIMNIGPMTFNMETVLLDIDIHHILRNLRNLKKLEIGICEMLTDKALCGDKMSLCEEITACSVFECNPWFQTYEENSFSISSLEKLESLIFRGNSAFTDEGILAIKIPTLRYIELPSSDYYTFKGIEKMINNNPSLENLFVQSSSKLSTNSISELRKMMTRMQLKQIIAPENPMVEFTRELRNMLMLTMEPNLFDDGALE